MRKSWVFKGLLFLVGLVAVDRGLFVLLDAGFRRIETGAMGGMVNRARDVRAEVVVLGSSRAWRHYDSTALASNLHLSVHNAGCDGQGLPYMRGLIDLLLRDYTPKMLILNVDASSIVSSAQALDRVTILAPFLDESPVVRDMIFRRGRFEPVKYLSRAYRYNDKVLAILSNLGQSDQTAGGFMPVNGRLDLRGEILDAPEDGCDDAQDLVEDAYLTALLRGSIRAARDAGVQVVLAASPRWRSDFHVAPREVPLSARIGEIAEQEGVPYIDINQENTPEFRDAALFADTAHLNTDGARLFSELLSRKLTGQDLAK